MVFQQILKANGGEDFMQADGGEDRLGQTDGGEDRLRADGGEDRLVADDGGEDRLPAELLTHGKEDRLETATLLTDGSGGAIVLERVPKRRRLHAKTPTAASGYLPRG